MPIKAGLFELMDAFQRILEKTAPNHKVDMTGDTIFVKEKISDIIDILEVEKSATLERLLGRQPTRRDVIATFLAILEMAKLNLVQIAQHVQTGIIRIFYL